MINVSSNIYRQKNIKLNQNNQKSKSDNIGFGIDRKNLFKYSLPVAFGLSILTSCDKDSISKTPSRQPQVFAPSVESIETFKKVAGAPEFGRENGIKKWDSGEIKICVAGQQNPEDKQELETRIIPELNQLIAPANKIVPSCQDPQVQLQYMPQAKMPEYFGSNYKPGNLGFFWGNYNDGKISNAKIAVDSTNRVTQQERNHLTREELTQSLGFMQDTSDTTSIFSQAWTNINEFSPTDREVIKMLYDPRVTPGMTMDQATSLFTPGSSAQIANNTSTPKATLPNPASSANPVQAVVPASGTQVSQQPTIGQRSRGIVGNLRERVSNVDWANLAVRANNGLRRINGETQQPQAPIASPQPSIQAQPRPTNPYATTTSAQSTTQIQVQGADPTTVGANLALNNGNLNDCYTTQTPNICIQSYNNTLRSK